MRAGVLPCTALIHECNAGNIVSIQKVIHSLPEWINCGLVDHLTNVLILKRYLLRPVLEHL